MKYVNVRSLVAVAAIVAGLGVAERVQADVVQLDLNGLTADAGGAFDGMGHSGSLSITANGSSSLNAIIVDGVQMNFTASLQSLTGSISTAFGAVTGGNISINLDDGSVFSAMIADGSGQIAQGGSQVGFIIPANFHSGSFNGPAFAGVDVSGFSGEVTGQLLLFGYTPNASGVDGSTNVDMFLVPAPGAIALLVMAGVVSGSRRRRSA